MKNARNYDDVSRFVSDRVDFKHGSCSGRTYVVAPLDTGRLDDDERKVYRQACDYAERSHQEIYVVCSYATPVAWAVGDYVYHVEQKFSVTTSKQQGKFRGALRGAPFPALIAT